MRYFAVRACCRIAVVVLLLGLAAGCAGRVFSGFPALAADAAAWPPPPLLARIVHVMDIESHQDLYDVAGFWQGVARVVAGPVDSRLTRPFAVALYPGGGLLIADPGRARVHFYDWVRGAYVALGHDMEGEPVGGLPSPIGLAVLPDGDILVADSRLGTVERFARGGSHRGTFIAAGVLARPAGMVFDVARGELLVADVLGHAIAVFDAEGHPLRRLGGRGAEPGQFNYPTFLALDPRGRLVVTDSMNFRVQVVAPDGTPVRTVGALGDAPGYFSKPKGVAVDAAGRLFAVEGLYDAIEIFDPEGRLLLSVGQSGAGPGEFWLPAGVAIDAASGLLFVADSYNARVQVFRILDAPATPPAPGHPASGAGVATP